MSHKITEGTKLVRVSFAAEEIKSSERHVWRLIANGELVTFRHGRITRITLESLHDYIAKHLDPKPIAAKEAEPEPDAERSQPLNGSRTTRSERPRRAYVTQAE